MKRVIRISYGLLSSKVFLLWMIGLWIVYYVFSAIWMNESFAHIATGLERRWLFRAPFILLLISGYLNLVRAFRMVLRQGKVQALLWIVFPLGLMLFASGYLISLSTRQFNWIIVGEGHDITPDWSSERYRAGKIIAGLKERFLDIDLNTGKGIFQYEPTLTVVDMSSREETVGVFPARKIGDSYFHILNFGLAPGVRIAEGNTVKEEGYMPLKILSGGSSDTFEVKPYPYRFAITFEPERTLEKGDLKASEFNLKNPLYSVRVFKGEKIIAEGMSVEPVTFDNLSISFFEPTTWIQIEIVRDPGYPIIVSSIFLMGIGILSSFVRLMGKVRKAGISRPGGPPPPPQ